MTREFKFPLWTQRYRWVSDFLEAHSDIKIVTDVGCGNGKICNWYRNIPHVERINFVDKDYSELDQTMNNYFTPPLVEMLWGRQETKQPLYIKVFHGDAAIPNDELIADCMIMIEVIEHLKPEDVSTVTSTIFGYYQPRYLVMTTPNRDFNCLFDSESSPDRYRHPDHKFEWTRSEFAKYCQQVCDTYPSYSFELDGVGHFGEDSKPYGPCSQIAAFERNSSIVDRDKNNIVRFTLSIEGMNIREVPDLVISPPKEMKLLQTYRVPSERETKEETINPFAIQEIPEGEEDEWATSWNIT